jgi:hypothetical protein
MVRDNGAVLHLIARQVRRMSDTEVYALTTVPDRVTREIAERVAHERAERYAMESES